jgi:hypothetical protein
MNSKRILTALALASCGVQFTCSAILADTETTTVRTTTVTNSGQELILPQSATYVLVDPLSGSVKGNFDPSRGVTDLRIVQPGLAVINQDTGQVIATVDSSGKTLDVASAPAFDSLVVAIDTRRADLERRIGDALARGTIDASQAGLLRADMDRITAEEIAAKSSGGVLTYSEALSVALALNGLGDRLIPLTHTSVVTPLLGARFASIDGRLVMVDELDYRKVHLQQRIDDEYTAGRLSAQQVARLKDQLNAVAAFEAKSRKHGQLSSSKTEQASNKLDNVKTRLDEDVAIINGKRSKMGIRVD